MLGLLALSLSLVTIGDAQDPYYQMEPQNLNTMNSYFIPQTQIPVNISGEIDLANYTTISYDLKNPDTVFGNADSEINGSSVLHFMSSYIGVWLQMLVFFLLWYMLTYRPKSAFSQTVGMAYEGIYEFFEDIMGNARPMRMKHFVTGLFFIILTANMLGWINDIIRFFFPWRLRNVTSGTGELEFNVALALVASCTILYTQYKTLGSVGKTIHEYLPVTGKGLMQDSKIGDIVISLFIGILDIIGFFARIISLSLRLFGNMSAGSILLNVAFLGLGAVTVSLLGLNFAFGIPLIVYIQGLLSVIIQAFVFSLIVAIGIKMASE